MGGIKATLQGNSGIKAALNLKTKTISPGLQPIWDGSSSADKNTFVDANRAEVASFIDSLTWDERVAILGRGGNYPQPTGQTTVYRTGDDADIEATIFGPVRAANAAKALNSLTDFLTLANTNEFGNTNRFTDDAGGQTYANDLIIDNYTMLMWYRVNIGILDWNTGIDNALASTQGGFSDWFVPNWKQIAGIFRADPSNKNFNYTPFSINTVINLSTTTLNVTTWNFQGQPANGPGFGVVPKTGGYSTYFCRKYA